MDCKKWKKAFAALVWRSVDRSVGRGSERAPRTARHISSEVPAGAGEDEVQLHHCLTVRQPTKSDLVGRDFEIAE